jgi:hypothetical protein
MAVLVIVYCLTSTPTSCQEDKPYLAPMPLMTCLIRGQQLAMDWLAEHPKWTLSRWRCEQNIPKEQAS